MRGQYPSIFGVTQEGVPNPQILHDHPYPTRYHGPIWTYPYFGKPFRQNPYASPPYAGFGQAPASSGLGGCGCALRPVAGGAQGTSGFGLDPDGLGAVNLTSSPTGSVLLDAIVGGALGAMMAKSGSDRVLWAGGGMVATLVGGALGLVGIVGAGAYVRRKEL